MSSLCLSLKLGRYFYINSASTTRSVSTNLECTQQEKGMLRLCMFPLSLLNYIYLIFKIFQSTAVHPIDKRIMLILTNTRYCLHQSLVRLELSFKETLYSNFKHVFLYRSSSIQCRHTLMKGYLYTNCNFLSQRSRIVLEKGCFVFYHFVNVR